MIRANLVGFLLLVLPLATLAQEDIIDPENKYFYKRYDTLSIEERNVPADVVKRLREDKAFWYMDSTSSLHRKVEKNEQNDVQYVPVGRRSWFQGLLWFVIIAGFAVFLGIYLSGSSIGLFRKKNKLQASPEEPGFIPEDIFAINYQREIEKAVAEGNYRLAVRLHFLRLLKDMSDRNLIRYKQDKTNFDYLTELASTSHYSQFFRATRNYEYSWYGLFPVSNDAYRTIKKDFDTLEQQLK